MLRASVGHLVVSAPLLLLAAACGSKSQTATGTGTGGSMNTGGNGGASGSTGGAGSGGTGGSAGTRGGDTGSGGAGTGGSGASGGTGGGGTGGGGAGGTITGAGGGCPPPPTTNGEECHAYDSRGYYAAGFWILSATCTPGVKCSFWVGGGLNVCAQAVNLQPMVCCEGWGFVTGLTEAVCPTLPSGEDPRCPPRPDSNCSTEGLTCVWETEADNGAGGSSGAGMKNTFPRVCCQGRWEYASGSSCSADAGAD